MRFVIDMVSYYSDEPGKKPCEGATLHTLHHKVRDEQVWVVELPDLGALLDLAAELKHELIVKPRSAYYDGMGRITVYDAYNE